MSDYRYLELETPPKSISNNVLIDLKKTYNELLDSGVERASGLRLLNTGDNPSEWCPRSGRITALPDKLNYNKKNLPGKESGMQWKTTIEVSVGDEVYFGYHKALQALGVLGYHLKPTLENMPKYVIVNGTVNIFIKYSELILSIKDDNITMLNGYSLIEPIDEELPKTQGIIFPDTMKKKSDKWGIVRYAGKPNEEYLMESWVDATGFKEGDYVLFDQWQAKYLEYDILQKLKNSYYYVQGRGIKAMIKK